MSAKQRIDILCDRHSFQEFDSSMRTTDPLSFRDSVRYKDRIKKAEKSSGVAEAVITGRARIEGKPVMIGVFDFGFLGGSMGIVVGDKLTRMIEAACAEDLPVVTVSSSGGARMHEGIYSLMQMAKVTASVVKLSEKHRPFISVLADPTTGGVAASFAMLGDINVAEPGALIGFAGPRVSEQTIKRQLPEGFQRAEFLLEHGMVDMVVSRTELRKKLSKLLELLTPQT